MKTWQRSQTNKTDTWFIRLASRLVLTGSPSKVYRCTFISESRILSSISSRFHLAISRKFTKVPSQFSAQSLHILECLPSFTHVFLWPYTSQKVGCSHDHQSLPAMRKSNVPSEGGPPMHPRLPRLPEVLGFLLLFLLQSVKGENTFLIPCVTCLPTQDSLGPAFQKSPTWDYPLHLGPRGGFIPHWRPDHRLLPAHFIFCWVALCKHFPFMQMSFRNQYCISSCLRVLMSLFASPNKLMMQV